MSAYRPVTNSRCPPFTDLRASNHRRPMDTLYLLQAPQAALRP